MLSAAVIIYYYELSWRTSKRPTRGRAKSQLSTCLRHNIALTNFELWLIKSARGASTHLAPVPRLKRQIVKT